jgi:hypothetical protein
MNRGLGAVGWPASVRQVRGVARTAVRAGGLTVERQSGKTKLPGAEDGSANPQRLGGAMIMTAPLSGQQNYKLRELCARLEVDYDEARYTLARGVLPKAIVQPEPGRGNHRQFDSSQAFYLAVALKLKAAGINTTLAAEISDWSRYVQGFAQNHGWDHRFAPFAGKLSTQHAWWVEVGDAKFVRLATDANPSCRGLYCTPWVEMQRRKECAQAQPAIVIRVDVAQIARQLSALAAD